MATLIVLAIALIAIYAIKAVLVIRSHDDLVEKSTSFCWMNHESSDESASLPRKAEEAAAQHSHRGFGFSLRRSAGFSA